MKEFCIELQQMQMIISYWTEQAESVVVGHGEKEASKLELKNLTVLKIRQDQRRLLNIFQEAEGTSLERLRLICNDVRERLEQIINEASDFDQFRYEAMLDEVYGNMRHLELVTAA